MKILYFQFGEKMGTRGLFGFYYKGKYYVVYNHFDSYPEGLGNIIVYQIINAIENGEFDSWLDQMLALKIVDYDMKPTEEDINKLKEFTNLTVSTQSTSDWYCLLHHCQGSLNKVLKSGYILNHTNKDGLPDFENYAYIINFDTNKFDFYIGEELTESYDFNDLPNW